MGLDGPVGLAGVGGLDCFDGLGGLAGLGGPDALDDHDGPKVSTGPLLTRSSPFAVW